MGCTGVNKESLCGIIIRKDITICRDNSLLKSQREGGRWGQQNDWSNHRGQHSRSRPTFMNHPNDRHGCCSEYGSSHYRGRQDRMSLRMDSNNDRKRSPDPHMNQYSEPGYSAKRSLTWGPEESANLSLLCYESISSYKQYLFIL